MKNTVFFLFVLLLVCGKVTGQNVSIDLLLNTNKDNFEFQLEKFVDEFIAEKEEGCISFNIIKDKQEGTSPYIIELWESDEFVNQYIFKNSRTRKVEGKDGKEVEKKYTAAGINVRAFYKVLGRMTERESSSIIDLFILDARIDKEIAEDEVRKKWKIKRSERKELSDFILTKYESDIEKKRKETQQDVKKLLGDHLIGMVANTILPPAMVTGINKQKKDKVKKITIDKCPEIDLTQYGTFYYAIYTMTEYGDDKVYNQVGSCYFDKEPGVMGVRKGEKELLPLIESNTPLYVGKHKSMDPHATTAEKTEQTKDISFIFFYEPTHTYTELERLNLEFLYQASFLDLKNVRVIADDKITQSINETTSQSIYTYDPEKKSDLDITLGDIKSNTTIFVGVSNAKKLELKSSFFKKDDFNPEAEYILAKAEYKDGDMKYESMDQFETFSNKIGIYINSIRVRLPEIKSPIVDENIKLLGIAEENKGKVKKVYVSGTVPLDDGDSYKLYTQKDFTKKTKEFAKLKIDELVNKYVAIAKVKKGDKVIAPYTDGKTPIYTKKADGGGLLGKAVRLAGGSSTYSGKIYYIRGKSDRI